jgi:hypothetical protein
VHRYARKLYSESQELSHRAIAGEITQATSKAAKDVFMRPMHEDDYIRNNPELDWLGRSGRRRRRVFGLRWEEWCRRSQLRGQPREQRHAT